MRPTQDLRLGRWEGALAGVKCDAIITDPPYGERVHVGVVAGSELPDDRRGIATDGLGYSHWGGAEVAAAVKAWDAACSGWIVALTSHDLFPAWEAAFSSVGRYVFSPLACVMPGGSVRLTGDGPSQWSVWAIASRPKTREFARWGTLPGAYVGKPNRDSYRAGGKPLWLMRALVRDYSRPGNTVCDPCAGGGTTLVAAQMEGRHSIGAECDPEAYEVAKARLAKRHQAALL